MPRPKPDIPRDYQLKVLLTQEERYKLERLAKQKGLTVSDFIRLWIREQK